MPDPSGGPPPPSGGDKPYVSSIELPERDQNPGTRIGYGFISLFTVPAKWIREKVVTPNQQDYPWYHKKYRRVPTIDECYMHDWVCREEANMQYRKDKLVEEQIIKLLRRRVEDCTIYEGPNSGDLEDNNPCYQMVQDWERASRNFYIKYGDLKHLARAEDVFMKQKHRMIWERRHGEVGAPLRPRSEWPEQ